ncbi:hypothetical protein ACTFIZ_009904 [Dictyostelium cf. discoideum]
MKERNSLKCPHLGFSIKEAEEYNFTYLWELTDADQFPMFQPGICTVEYISINRLSRFANEVLFLIFLGVSFATLIKQVKDYFEDCKMIFSHETRSLSLGEYVFAIQQNKYTKKAEFLTNLQYIDGKVVRFCEVPKENDETGQEENK